MKTILHKYLVGRYSSVKLRNDDDDDDNDNDDDDNLFNESDVYKKYVLIRLLSRELISPRIFTIENILFIIYYMSCFIVYM